MLLGEPLVVARRLETVTGTDPERKPPRAYDPPPVEVADTSVSVTIVALVANTPVELFDAPPAVTVTSDSVSEPVAKFETAAVCVPPPVAAATEWLMVPVLVPSR